MANGAVVGSDDFALHPLQACVNWHIFGVRFGELDSLKFILNACVFGSGDAGDMGFLQTLAPIPFLQMKSRLLLRRTYSPYSVCF